MTDDTERFGPHANVIHRPPRRNKIRGDGSVADIVRLECLDCGFCTQGHPQTVECSLINEVSCNEMSHPGGYIGEKLEHTVDAATLSDEHRQLANDLADETHLKIDEVAGAIKQLSDHTVPTDEIERTLREVAEQGGQR
jgi:hypothetical protein